MMAAGAPVTSARALYGYAGKIFPRYLREGNACQHIQATALHFCRGRGLDVGCGNWPIYGAQGVDLKNGGDAYALPEGEFDFIFSSHCLEHLVDPIRALRHWTTRLKPGAPMFLYLPHPDMDYWLPQNCTKHLHTWRPADMARIVADLGLADVIHSERDLAWSFAVVGFNGGRDGN